jgi:hypothetical protein
VEVRISQRPWRGSRVLNTIPPLRPIHDKPREVRKAITPNPAENLLQYLTLAYIHDELVSIVESSPMSEYRDAYLWLLATQIPIAIKNCCQHESPKPLLDALSEACGNDHERTWILGNITAFTMEVSTTTGRVKWPSLTNDTLVETPIVAAKIASYPAPGSYIMKPWDRGWQNPLATNTWYATIHTKTQHSVTEGEYLCAKGSRPKRRVPVQDRSPQQPYSLNPRYGGFK